MEQLPKLTVAEWQALVGDARYVLEVGSHDGDDTALLAEAFPNARMFCWEPDWRPRARFRDRVGWDERITLYADAVSDAPGYATWWASHGDMQDDPCRDEFSREMQEDWDASGSIMRPTGHDGFPKWLRFVESGTVRTTTLDRWLTFHGEVTAIDLLWADIQGAELKLIAGAEQTLAITRFAYLEVYDKSLTPKRNAPAQLYENQPTLEELRAALRGWTLLGWYNADSVLFRNDHAAIRI